jgi:hypothetical protein
MARILTGFWAFLLTTESVRESHGSVEARSFRFTAPSFPIIVSVMLVFTMAHLRSLARVYSEATGVELKTLGSRAADNWKLFTRLDEGFGCSAKGAEASTRFFINAWPDLLPWPDDVPDLRPIERRQAAAMAQRRGQLLAS